MESKYIHHRGTEKNIQSKIQLFMFILIFCSWLEGLTRDLCKGLSKLVPSGASNNQPPQMGLAQEIENTYNYSVQKLTPIRTIKPQLCILNSVLTLEIFRLGMSFWNTLLPKIREIETISNSFDLSTEKDYISYQMPSVN